MTIGVGGFLQTHNFSPSVYFPTFGGFWPIAEGAKKHLCITRLALQMLRVLCKFWGQQNLSLFSVIGLYTTCQMHVVLCSWISVEIQ
jgi:hypothetical protein